MDLFTVVDKIVSNLSSNAKDLAELRNNSLEGSMDGLWQNVEVRVRDRLGQVGFETCIAPTELSRR